jgi:two-component system chemotaxis response regulator CheY
MATILFVDDSAYVRRMAAGALRRIGHDVVEAAGALAALSSAPAKADLVFTDLSLPDMDGAEFIARLRATPEFRFIPVIMLANPAQALLVQDGKAAHATGFILKPYTPEEIVSVAGRLLRPSGAPPAKEDHA